MKERLPNILFNIVMDGIGIAMALNPINKPLLAVWAAIVVLQAYTEIIYFTKKRNKK